MSLLSKKIFFIFFLLFIGISIDDAHSQSNDTSHSVTKPLGKLYAFDIRMGWGSQKQVFVGLQCFAPPFLLRGDIGYDLFSSKYFTLSYDIGWVPGVKNVNSEISSIYFSFIQTIQYYNTSPSIYTINIGWFNKQNRSLDFAFSVGAGIKVVSSLEKSNLFLGLDLSIGYRFF